MSEESEEERQSRSVENKLIQSQGKKAPKKVTKSETQKSSSSSELRMNGFTIDRPHLVKHLVEAGESVGLTFICAPYGFGKTALLLDYVKYVRMQQDRGIARALDANYMSAKELYDELITLKKELSSKYHPLVAIDNVPYADLATLKLIASLLRSMCRGNFEIVATVASNHHPLVTLMSDSIKIGPQMLKLQVKELSGWVNHLAIAPQIDLYAKTRGIPALVCALQGQTTNVDEPATLDKELYEIYHHIIQGIQDDKIRDIIIAMLLMKWGTFESLRKNGIKVTAEHISVIAHDFPLFGIDQSKLRFQCLKLRHSLWSDLLTHLVSLNPILIMRVLRTMLEQNRVDDTVECMHEFLCQEDIALLVEQFPLSFPLAGHSKFVLDTFKYLVDKQHGYENQNLGFVLSAYISTLLVGDFKLSACLARHLARFANHIVESISCENWSCAQIVAEMFAHTSSLQLPHVSYGLSDNEFSMSNSVDNKDISRVSPKDDMQQLQSEVYLRLHLNILKELLRGGISASSHELINIAADNENEINIPLLFVFLDNCIVNALQSHIETLPEENELLEKIANKLKGLHLKELSEYVLAVQSIVYMFDRGVGDEKHRINQLQISAVRRSSIDVQLFCRIAEGWNELLLGQAVNAHFRAQQTLKICPAEMSFLTGWTRLLETCSMILMSSQLKLREKIATIDLDIEEVNFFDSWRIALLLSGAKYDSELSAWYSKHKVIMLNDELKAYVRLAITSIGSSAESLRRLIPLAVAKDFLPKKVPDVLVVESSDDIQQQNLLDIGQITIRLFGGFRVDKNGHLLTEKSWRRRKAATLCARLALVNGSFVSRRVLTEELWPRSAYQKSRESLYVTLSQLRRSLGQSEEGTQYIVTHGDSIGLNSDYVATDVQQFDNLVRNVLLHSSTISTDELLDACLKLESIYSGPIYIPEDIPSDFFTYTQEAYENKFIDAMVVGCKAAQKEKRISVATWLINAALRQNRYREDVVREAMIVMHSQGRRREIIQLYNSHLGYLSRELKVLPEKETRTLYEHLIKNTKNSDTI